MAVSKQNQQIFNDLSNFLSDLGLMDLFQTNTSGEPSGWLWNQIVQGYDTAAEVLVRLENTKSFQNRYKIIFDMRQRAAAGEPVQVPSVQQVRDYEKTASEMMRQAGLPAWFYDSYKDMQRLMANDISTAELELRIATGWDTVRNVDPAVREAFSSFYGIQNGDAALAAFVLDPKLTQSEIERASRAAYTSGYGKTMGITVDKATAEKLANMPQTLAGLQQGLQETSKMQSLFAEGITETQDLTSQTGIEANMLGNADAQQQIEQRILERQAQSRSSQGGAAMTQQGLVGLKNV